MTLRTTLFACMMAATAATTAQADKGYDIHVRSDCPEEMRLAVRFLSPGAEWRSESWWDFDPEDSFYLSSDGVRLQHVAGTTKLYMYAETVSGRGHFHTDTRPEDYNLIKIRDFRFVFGRAVRGTYDGDVFRVTLACNDR